MKFEIGKEYTVVGISEMMALTVKTEMKVKEVREDGKPVFVARGKRKLQWFGRDIGRDMLVFAGWDIPLKIDTEQEAVSDGLFSSKIFNGNACFNFMGTPEFVKSFIDQNNINEYFARHDAVLAHGERATHESGTCVYPEVPTTHAVVLRIREKSGGNKAPEVVSEYSREQAKEDGVLTSNPAQFAFPECDVITTHLWEYAQERVNLANFVLTEPMDLMKALMGQAKRMYDNNTYEGDNDKDFFVIKGDAKVKDVWFVRNEAAKLTAMLPEDY